MSNKVFVGGLDWDTTEESLESAFCKIGEISEVKVIRDRDTGRSRGFGFITFMDSADAEKSIDELNGVELDGRTIRVNLAEDRNNRGQGDFRGGQNRSRSRW